MFNPLTPGAFWQKWFFGHFGYLQPGYEPNKLQSIQNRIFNVTEGLSFHQHYFCFMIFLLLYAQKTKLQDLLLQAFFIFFFGIFFFSFSHLFAAVVALLLGLLSVQKFFRKRHRNRSSQVLAMDQPRVVERKVFQSNV